MDTDIALTTFTGDDGLNVFARSLQTAQPLAEPRSRAAVARQRADRQGRHRRRRPRHFRRRPAARAAAPPSAGARHGDRRRQAGLHRGSSSARRPFDLSDRGIDGPRPARPGRCLPLHRARRLSPRRDGAAHGDAARRRGRGAEEHAGDADRQAARRQRVHALSPRRCRRRARCTRRSTCRSRRAAAVVGRRPHRSQGARRSAASSSRSRTSCPRSSRSSYRPSQPVLRPARSTTFDLQADFLYGAPASGLTVESDLRITVDANALPRLRQATASARRTSARTSSRRCITLNGAGHRRPRASRASNGAATRSRTPPCRCAPRSSVRVFEPGGGRATKTDKSLPMRTRDVYLGIRPTFEGRYAREGTDTAVRHRGGRRRRQAGRATGRRILDRAHRPRSTSGTRSTAAGAGSRSPTRGWSTADTAVAQGRRAGAALLQAPELGRRIGSRSPTARTTPRPRRHLLCRLVRRLGQRRGDARHAAASPATSENYAPGETARCASRRRSPARRCSPSPPTASSARATSRCRPAARPSRCRSRPTGAPAPMRWSPPGGRSPSRPIARRRAPSALAWLGARSRACARSPCRSARPRRSRRASASRCRCKVANLEGEEAFVTLAAVDEGILQLTRFKTPKPADYYFGKRRLGVAMRDDYGRLLDTRADDLGRIRVGGDAGDIGGLDIVPTRTVALFSGPVKLDAKGEAKIALEIPDFIGQLRLMAVAYAKSRVGSADQRLFVRDAVSADVVLPRFLAPNDRGRVALSLHNVDGQAGDYRADPRGDGRGVARPAGRRDAAARRQPARAADLAAGRGRRGRLRQGRGRGLGPRQLRGAPRMGHPGARGADAERRRHRVPARARRASSRSTATSRRPSRPAPRRSSVALSRIPGIDVAGPAAGARQVSVRLHRADDQPRPAAALLQRRGAARVTGRPIRASATACRMRSTASSTCRCPTARSACGGPSRRRPPNGCRPMRSTSCCAPATRRWRCRRPRCSAA